MKKLNSKGFMMTELLAVTIVVLTVFIVIYTNYLPTRGEYENRLQNNDIDTMYANFYFRIYLLKYFEKDSNRNILRNVDSGGFYNVIINDSCKINSRFEEYNCDDLKTKYKIKDAVITKYNPGEDYSGPLSDYIKTIDAPATNNDEIYRITIKTDKGYSTNQLFSRSQKTYGDWSSWTKDFAAGEICEKPLCESKEVTEGNNLITVYRTRKSSENTNIIEDWIVSPN